MFARRRVCAFKAAVITSLLLIITLFGFEKAYMYDDTSSNTVFVSNAEEYISQLKSVYDQHRDADLMETDTNNASRTLLVQFCGALDDKKAIADICDRHNVHTLIYTDSAIAESEYDRYMKLGLNVCRDEILSISSESDLSWGPSFIGAQYFIPELVKAYPSAENMPPVKVAVIDTGIEGTHSFLANRVDMSLGYDFYNGDNDPSDDNDHGTHVAGIIADCTLSNVILIPIKVAGAEGNLSVDTLKAGLDYAINLGADVINLSLSTTSENRKLTLKKMFADIFQEAADKGIVICAAAGNARGNYANNADYVFPANMDNTIAVANCKSNGSINENSNYGSVIDLSAPGTNINSCISNGKYAYKSGTSASCAFASAAAALILTKSPEMTPFEMERVLCENTVPYQGRLAEDYSGKYGEGILDISNIYSEIAGDSGSITTPTESPMYDGEDSWYYRIAEINIYKDEKVTDKKNIRGEFDIKINIASQALYESGSIYLSVCGENGSLLYFDGAEIADAVMFHIPELAEPIGEINAFIWKSLESQEPLAISVGM